mmetsp:Transcript_80754/g.228768  ORF Transcript_80754/g.228768 Transcript_80754/m.228768 type:complete len:234 (+) Transcript_80754:1045-1746(+)
MDQRVPHARAARGLRGRRVRGGRAPGASRLLRRAQGVGDDVRARQHGGHAEVLRRSGVSEVFGPGRHCHELWRGCHRRGRAGHPQHAGGEVRYQGREGGEGWPAGGRHRDVPRGGPYGTCGPRQLRGEARGPRCPLQGPGPALRPELGGTLQRRDEPGQDVRRGAQRRPRAGVQDGGRALRIRPRPQLPRRDREVRQGRRRAGGGAEAGGAGFLAAAARARRGLGRGPQLPPS